MVLACCVGLSDEERVDELRGVGDEVLMLAIDGVDGKNGILPYIGVSVLKAGANSWDEGFKELDVAGDLLEETKSCAANVFVWMLQVVSNGITVSQ